jgi:ribosomal protein L11 methyltransferase
VSAVVSGEAADAAGAILRDLPVSGLIESRSPSGDIRLRCYVLPSRRLAAMMRILRSRIRGLVHYGLDPGPARVTQRTVAQRKWATAWRAYARPIRIGRLVVTPSWIRVPEEHGAIAITIDPGMAFGSGLHPTTRLCLRILRRYLPRPPRPRALTVIDLGTGSGILAIAAARLGAGRVWAVDHDPVAVTVARANARLNDVARGVQVAQGSGLARAPRRADIIAANLTAETIIGLFPTLRRHLASRGLLAASGIVADQLPAVLHAAAAEGLRVSEILSEGEWRAVVLAR